MCELDNSLTHIETNKVGLMERKQVVNMKGYRLTRKKIDYVNKRETFFYTKGVGQYLTITIQEGSKVEIVRESSGSL